MDGRRTPPTGRAPIGAASLLGHAVARLEELGLPIGTRVPSVMVGTISAPYYDPSQEAITIPPELADNANAVLAQYIHHALLTLPGRSQSELSGPARAIESGLSWFLTCSVTGDAQYGVLNLADRHHFPEQSPAEMGKDGPRADVAWAAAFWGMRAIAPPRTVEAVLVAAYCTVLDRRSTRVWAAFTQAVLADVRLGAYKKELSELFQLRGLPLHATK